MKNILKSAVIGGALLFSQGIMAQVKYQLTLLPDNKTYLVSLIPQKTWDYPLNLTSTAQVTIKVPSDKEFTAAVTNMNPDVKWIDNSYIESPQSDPAHTYVSFGLVSLGTDKIIYKENEEVMLFSFQNIADDNCIGKISLIDNEKDAFKGKDAETWNIGNQISVLAAEGDVYNGNLRTDADCSKITGIKDFYNDVNVKAYPIPAQNQFTIEWTAVVANPKTVIQIETMDGRIIEKRDVSVNTGQNKADFDFTSLPGGGYNFSFISEGKSSKRYQFLIIK